MRFLLIALLSACLPVDFVRTDPAHVAVRKADLPAVFVDRLPQAAYHSIGILQMDGKIPLSDMIQALAERGREEGCDLVIDRQLHRVSVRATVSLDLASYTPIPPPVTQPQQQPPFQSQPTIMREFICGVYEPSSADGI